MTSGERLAGLVNAFFACVGVATLALPTTAAWAADAGQETLWVRSHANGTVISTAEITIHPAAEPRPALRYRLLPAEEDLVDGNAAIHYLKALAFLEEDDARKRIEELRAKADKQRAEDGTTDWPPGYEARASALPLPEVREFLTLHQSQVPWLAEAVRRRHCDWERRIADSDNPVAYRFPELNGLRHLARVESLRCRLAIAEGRIDDALAVLRRLFTLARHLGKDESCPFGPAGLGAVFAAVGDALELAQLPDAPNLYWACAAMPQPFIDRTRMMATERSMLYRVMKSLRDVDETPRPVEYWQAFIDRDVRALARAMRDSDYPLPFFRKGWGSDHYQHGVPSHHEPDALFRLRAAAFVATAYPGARRYLAEECGLPTARLEALPTAQVVFLAMRRFYDASADERTTWAATPSWIALPKLWAARDTMRADAGRIGPSAIPAFRLDDSIGFAVPFSALGEQQIAILQTVEALRLHAAIRGGLPESLAGLTVPAPTDPATGQPIAYSVAGNRAVLEPAEILPDRRRIIIHLAP
jgi:hypothetical protein